MGEKGISMRSLYVFNLTGCLKFTLNFRQVDRATTFKVPRAFKLNLDDLISDGYGYQC